MCTADMAEYTPHSEAFALETETVRTSPPRVAAAPGGAARPTGGGGAARTWKQHIIRQLKHRDRTQHAMYQDLINSYTRLMEKSCLTKELSSCPVRHPNGDNSRESLHCQSDELKKTTGELAYAVWELQHKEKAKDSVLEEQQAKLAETQQELHRAEESKQELQANVKQVEEGNMVLKGEYDTLLQRRQVAELKYMREEAKSTKVQEEMMSMKKQAAIRMNTCNERKSRAREARLQRDLQTATRSTVSVDSPASVPPTRSASIHNGGPEPVENRHPRLLRSASDTSPRILSTIRELFERRKRRGNSVSSLVEDQCSPVRICLCARVPAIARHILDAHEQGINAVKFSSNSNLIATGGTDKVIKLWEVGAGALHYRTTLYGPTEGITSVEFDPMGMRILAASYDRSAILWRLDESVPKLTLTGHSRKVTAARFSRDLHHVVTGSTDRTIRLWDLRRAACVQETNVSSSCNDLVCAESYIISGHFDSKIRLWDTRTEGCAEISLSQGKVTSLDLSPDHRQLLSCCRDDCLQVTDLRRGSSFMCFRADGFKCGSDSTKAVFSPDGGLLAAGSADGAVYIWNVSNGNLEARLLHSHSSTVTAVSWSPSGDYLVSVDKSRRAVLWSDI